MREMCASVRPIRYGWARSVIDDQQRDYIIARERVIETLRQVYGIPWQCIDAENQVLAEKIHANTVHALRVLALTMRDNESKLLG